MALLEIVQYPDEILREKCVPVDQITDEVKTLLDSMAETMYEAPGIGLAAPQVGKSIRVIVVDVGEDENPQLYKLINPEILEQEGSCEYEEGCLSIPEIREKVTRADRVVVKALNENGEELIINADGLLAICLQHEIDHLNGILFIDHLSRLKREMIKKRLKKLSN